MNRIQAQEKRISIKDLLNFIKTNVDVIKTIGCVDLDCVSNDDTKKSHRLDQLNFQDVQRITFLPPNLSKIFDISNTKYLHAGVLKECTEKKSDNISLYSSVISCLKQTFLSYPMTYQDSIISRFVVRFKSESKGLYDKFNYRKFKWTRNSLGDDIESNTLGKNVAKYLADYMHINLFILDISEDILYYCNGTHFVPFKKNIFLIRYDDGTYEPFFTEHTRFITHNDKLIKTLMGNLSLLVPFNFSDGPGIVVIEENEDLALYTTKINDSQIKIKVTEHNDLLNMKSVTVEPKPKTINEEYDEDMNGFDDDSFVSDAETISNLPSEESTKKALTKNIWLKKKKDSPSADKKSTESKNNTKKVTHSSTKSESPKKTNKATKIDKPSMSMTLDTLKILAKKYGISTTTKKDGKTINKTKSDLCTDINKKLKSK